MESEMSTSEELDSSEPRLENPEVSQSSPTSESLQDVSDRTGESLTRSDDALLDESDSPSPLTQLRPGFDQPSFLDNDIGSVWEDRANIDLKQYLGPLDTTSDSGYSENPSTRSRGHGSRPATPPRVVADEVAKLIRRSFERSAEDGQYFLPHDKLCEIINIEAVRNILLESFSRRGLSFIDHLQSRVLEKPDKPLRRKIFAILIMIGRVYLIEDFVEGGINDDDLPLRIRTNNQGEGLLQELCKGRGHPPGDVESDEGLEPLECLRKWSWIDMESFESRQSFFCVPIFEGPGEGSPCLNLEHGSTLPYLEVSKPLAGGYGSVRKVKIHDSHYNTGTGDKVQKAKGKIYFAIKELHSTQLNAYEEEMELFDKLSVQHDHPKHLIQLQFSYFHSKHYFLAFPWADGNLREFWQKGPKSNPGDQSQTIWFFTQCMGLVQALQKIHYVISMSKVVQLRDGPNNRHINSQVWGRHGDLKPENILWFKTHDGMENFLVISDFGLTRFNTANSKSKVSPDAIAGYSGTYRPPEMDLNIEISPRYDIWSLGCVFLEFVSWFLLGYEETHESFTTLRLEDEKGERVPEDKFFVITDLSNVARHKWQASLKPAVIKWIEKLHQHKQCTEPLHAFLDLIETRMLQPASGERFKCGEIALELGKLMNECESNEAYATLGTAGTRNLSRFPTLHGSSMDMKDSDACRSSNTATNTATNTTTNTANDTTTNTTTNPAISTATDTATNPISWLLSSAFSLAITNSLRSILSNLRRILALPRLWQSKRVSEAPTSC